MTSATLTQDQQSWLRLLHKLLSPDTTTSPPQPSSAQSPDIASSADSSGSLASAMRQLFDMKSSTSVVGCRSTSTTDSIREAILHLFDSDDSIIDRSSAKSPSFPATPCNSMDSMNAGKTAKQALSAQKALSSEDLREALRRLFCVSDSDLKRVLPGASDDSISSLGSAMRNLFYGESESAVRAEKSTVLSTSNDSLHEALSWLFRQSSISNLSCSSSTDIIWNLLDSEPEEFSGVDVKALNQKRNSPHSAHMSCQCRLPDKNVEKRNPSLSSVIRSSSPDRDVNITFPTANQQKAQQPKSLIPRPLATRTALPRPSAHRDENSLGFVLVSAHINETFVSM